MSPLVVSSKPRPWVRPLGVWLLAAMAMTLCTAAGFLLAVFVGGRRVFWTIAPVYIRVMAKGFGIRRHLLGWEDLPEDLREGHRPAIYVANHASLLDPPLIISTLPCHPVFLAKRELAMIPVLGWAMWLAGFIFLDRLHGRKSLASLHKAAQRIREGQSVVIFPEGTRSRDGRLQDFKRGAFKLALEAKVPLIPLAIFGGFEILPRNEWRTHGLDYRLSVGTPLDPSSFSDSDSLCRSCQKALSDMLDRGANPNQQENSSIS